MTNPVTARKKALFWVVGVILVFLCVEGLVFRGSWYADYLEPDSSAGNLEFHLRWLKEPPPPDISEVLVVGDSRMAEGFSSRIAKEKSGGRVQWWNLGTPGTTPRVWYYLMRDADPQRNRFHTVVFALDLYPDLDRYDSGPQRILDLNYLICRLRLTDVWEFSRSMGAPEIQRAAFVGLLLKGNTLRDDFLAFAGNIRARKEKVELIRRVSLSSIEDYGGVDRNLKGLSIDQNQKIHFPDEMDDEVKRVISEMHQLNLPPQKGVSTEYRMKWFTKIMDLYAGSRTQFVFLEAPRGPISPVIPPVESKFIEWVRQQPNVKVLDQQTFRFLETPETFFDALHLNRTGRALFTEKLVQSISIP